MSKVVVKQLTLDDAYAAGRDGMEAVERTAGEMFALNARAFVLRYLEKNESARSEDIVDECKKAGIAPHSDRAFGAVFKKLQSAKLIEKCGHVARRKGHGAMGGAVWKLC